MDTVNVTVWMLWNCFFFVFSLTFWNVPHKSGWHLPEKDCPFRNWCDRWAQLPGAILLDILIGEELKWKSRNGRNRITWNLSSMVRQLRLFSSSRTIYVSQEMRRIICVLRWRSESEILKYWPTVETTTAHVAVIKTKITPYLSAVCSGPALIWSAVSFTLRKLNWIKKSPKFTE